MKKIEIEIPDGKRAEWVNGVLKLVDEEPKFKNGRLANDEEKQIIFDALAKDGKRWNAEKLCIEDIEQELPKTWEESLHYGEKTFCINTFSDVICSDYKSTGINRFRNSFHTKEQAEAMLAFIQLIWLRDIYRQGWKPDYGRLTEKYGIKVADNVVQRNLNIEVQRPLSFQSTEIRDLFLENFRDLIEKAKMFI